MVAWLGVWEWRDSSDGKEWMNSRCYSEDRISRTCWSEHQRYTLNSQSHPNIVVLCTCHALPCQRLCTCSSWNTVSPPSSHSTHSTLYILSSGLSPNTAFSDTKKLSSPYSLSTSQRLLTHWLQTARKLPVYTAVSQVTLEPCQGRRHIPLTFNLRTDSA